VPPLAERLKLKATPLMPATLEALMKPTVLTVMVSVAEAVLLLSLASVRLSVTLKVPRTVALPVIWPVELLNVRPEGSEPVSP